MAKLSTIGFDADDTLWQNEQFFRLTEKRFAALLAGPAQRQRAQGEVVGPAGHGRAHVLAGGHRTDCRV